MRKEDLKDGMVVEQRKGSRYLVLGQRMYSYHFYNDLKKYSEDLNAWIGEETHKEFGIVRVYKVKETATGFANLLDEDNLELIWERKEYPILTRFQHDFLEKMAEKYNWMAVDSGDYVSVYTGVWFYENKPTERSDVAWRHPNGRKCKLDDALDDYDFMKWEDEPWNIRELLENCEVKESC